MPFVASLITGDSFFSVSGFVCEVSLSFDDEAVVVVDDDCIFGCV